MQKTLLSAVVALLSMMCASCSHGSEPTPAHIARLDKAVTSYPTLDQTGRQALCDTLSPELGAMMRVLGYAEVNDSSLTDWSRSMAVQMFTPLVDSVFAGGLGTLEGQVGGVMQRAGEARLDLGNHRFAAVVWGIDKSIVTVDTVVLIALNHYLGPESEAYHGWPTYQRVNKRPEMMPYDLIEAMTATRYPYQAPAEGPTVLSRMLYEGALTAVKMQTVPEANLPNALGMSASELADVGANREFIWQKMASGQMLYSTDQGLADHLFGAVPFASPIHQGAPAHTARAIGYEIVSAWQAEHPDATLADLLRPEFYNSKTTLGEAKYKPRNAKKEK